MLFVKSDNFWLFKKNCFCKDKHFDNNFSKRKRNIVRDPCIRAELPFYIVKKKL